MHTQYMSTSNMNVFSHWNNKLYWEFFEDISANQWFFQLRLPSSPDDINTIFNWLQKICIKLYKKSFKSKVSRHLISIDYLLIKHRSCHHTETSQLICSSNQLASLYMMATLAFNELTNNPAKGLFTHQDT